tara:strand:- start:668 stop:2077 length:1410 start_codon:yes stop_codon:yes gene_type:complete
MTQIPILSGIYSDGAPDLRESYPVNLVPVPKQNGISNGYLRPADGIVQFGVGPGIDRGGINWNGVCYRVMGTSLVSVESNGVVTVLGDVGGASGSYVTMDYSFDRLSIASAGGLYYWDGAALTKVSDSDLGLVIDQRWVDGYFMTTDGTSLVVTELTDPTQVNPLKYGSAEADPDPIKAILKLRNEIYALNRNTIEVFDNVGGDFFPFRRIEGAQIQKGVVGTHACCVYMETVAFLGSSRNEAPGIYLGANASAVKISTREIDTVLLGYTEEQLAGVKLEARNDKANNHLWVHLPDRTIVYDAAASKAIEDHVWFILTSGLVGFNQYRARNAVWCYNQWMVGDTATANLGTLDDQTGYQWGQLARWEFGTTIIYNGSRGVVFHELELVPLAGRVALGSDPTISTSYSMDGETWSQPKRVRVGTIGNRTKRLVWFQQGIMRNWRIQRFQGDSAAHLAFIRLEAQLEPLGA